MDQFSCDGPFRRMHGAYLLHGDWFVMFDFFPGAFKMLFWRPVKNTRLFFFVSRDSLEQKQLKI